VNYPSHVKLVEVGPRDGLQNEPVMIPTAVKVELIDRIGAAGVQTIETTSFVSPKWIPQLADAAEVYRSIKRRPGTAYTVLVPNIQGLKRALAVGVEEIAVFTAASETFNRKNINVSIEESIERFVPVLELAKARGLRVRGYVSCALGCPYEGDIPPEKVASVARELVQLGCYEISLGDTIGVGTPLQAQRMVDTVMQATEPAKLAVHFHDTRGQALANILACLQLGIVTVDASIGGLGGCPYANGARGNVASEDLLYMLHGMGIETGVDLDKLLDASLFISDALGREPESRLGKVYARQRASRAGTKGAAEQATGNGGRS
jgi:isopropylmalate/homocitrate/citramalate synthase